MTGVLSGLARRALGGIQAQGPAAGLARRCFLGLGGLACAAAAHQPEVRRARIAGSVRDPFATPIPGVRITITSAQSGLTRRTRTKEDGSYVSGPLRLGEYRVMAEHPAYQRAVREGVLLETQQTVVVDLVMERGPGPRDGSS